MINFSIQKGRIFEILKKRISKKMFFKFKNNDRRLSILNTNKDIEISFARSKDVKIIFKEKISDFFIMGIDTYLENKLDYKFFKIKKFKCKLSLIRNKKKNTKKKTIYTKYPNIIKEYKKYNRFNIKKATGCLELYLKKKKCRYIFDIVDTGKTVKENNLFIEKKIKSVFLICLINKKVKLSKINRMFNYLNEF